MSAEQLKNTENSLAFPHTYKQLLLEFPQLQPLLVAFENRDYGTFMHSVAVHSTATRLIKDLFLLLKTQPAAQQAVYARTPFLLLHDIGKTAASPDIKDHTVSRSLVHPANPNSRPSYDTARHWIHPQMSGDLLDIWADTTSPSIRLKAKKWARLAYLHDKKLTPYLPKNNMKNLDWADRFALFIFSLSDTSMAMGLPRPNKKHSYSQTEIRQVLYRNHLSDTLLLELFPAQDTKELKHFVLASILDSLQELKKNYPESFWIKPSTQPDQTKTGLLDSLIATAWKEQEQFWEATMMRMDLERLFRRR